MFFALYLLVLSSLKLAEYTKSATDENLFRNAPSLLYVVSNYVLPNDDSVATQTEIDTIKVSDLILSVAGKKVNNLYDWQDVLNGLPKDAPISIKIFRTLEDKVYECSFIPDTLPANFVEQIPEFVYVQNVTLGGVSDLAGMQKGDLIYRIDDRSFSTAREADVIMRQVHSGTTTLYDIIRNNERIVLPVTMAKFGITLAIFVMYLAGLIFWGFGAFIGVRRAGLIAGRLLGFAFLCLGFALMTSQMLRSATVSLINQFVLATISFAMVFGVAFWNHSKLYFPEPRPEILENRKLIVINYVLAFSCFVLFCVSLFFNPFNPFWQRLIANNSFALLMCYSLLIHFLYRKQRSKEYRKIRNILSGLSFTAVPLAILFAVLAINLGYPNQIGFMGLFLLIIPLGYFYVIGKYHLLDLNIKVNRSIQYTIIVTAWIVFLSVIFIKILSILPSFYFEIPNLKFTGTSFIVLDVPPDPKTHEFWEKLLIITMALTAAFLFLKIGRSGNKFIEDRFNRGQYNLSTATSELAEIMATKLGMEELAKGVVERLAKLMHLKRVGIIFFRDQKSCCGQHAFGFDGHEWDEVCLNYGEKLVSEIKRFSSESRFSVDYLQSEIKKDFLKHGFRHIFPIRFKDRLVGTFVIGEKLSETPLHLEDLSFLAAVAKQTSIAIENAFLHEELTEQARLKHELKIARRIQMASLPQQTPDIDGLEIAGSSIPALEVGGDYFDYLNSVPNGLTIIVGDVSGKGTSAALYMSKVQGIIRTLHAFNLSPKELFTRANQLLRQDMDRKSFVTAIGGCFNAGKKKLCLARAGHLPLFYYNAKVGEVQQITPKGLGLGLKKAEAFGCELEEIRFGYKSGDIFLFVTDGITEAQTNFGEEFGEDRLEVFLKTNHQLDARSIQDGILEEVKNFVASALPHDDQTIVVVKAV